MGNGVENVVFLRSFLNPESSILNPDAPESLGLVVACAASAFLVHHLARQHREQGSEAGREQVDPQAREVARDQGRAQGAVLHDASGRPRGGTGRARSAGARREAQVLSQAPVWDDLRTLVGPRRREARQLLGWFTASRPPREPRK